MPRFDRSASMDSSSAVLRANRSGLVTVSHRLGAGRRGTRRASPASQCSIPVPRICGWRRPP
jgi:hypothetical protein